MFNRIFIKYYTDNIELNLGVGGKTIATDDIGGIQHELVKVEFGVDGAATMVSSSNPLPVVDSTAIAAGSAIIGKVGIDQTTPGTTNGVQVNAALPAGTNLLGITQSKDIPDASATYALTNVSSTAYEASHILKASAGYLFMVTGYNSKTSSQFIQLHNTTSVPSEAAVPVVIFNVPASSNFSFDLGKFGRYFSTGITILNSSTGPTKTIGTTDCWFDAQII